jgi:hypothetical protein
MQRRIFLKLGSVPVVSGALSACGSNGDDGGGNPGSPGSAPGGGPVAVPVEPAAHDNTVTGWTRTALQAVRQARPGPPMAARSFAILHTCMYNAWCAYDPLARPTRKPSVARRPLAECTAANKAVAMSYAAYTALVDQFPAQKDMADACMESLGYASGQTAGAQAAAGPAAVGMSIARVEIEYCHADGANQLGDLTPSGVPYADYTGYVPSNPPMIVTLPTTRDGIPAPSRWQPLTYADAAGVVRTPGFVGAHWERVKPFALASSRQFRPGPPPAYGSAEYSEQVRRILEVQGALTEEHKLVSEYWSDLAGTDLPPGHWVRFGLYVSTRDRHTDDQDIKMFFALSNALADTAIAVWDAKRTYDSERPITAVRYLMSGQTIRGYGLPGPAAGLRSIDGATWLPYQPLTFPTPPFPEHVSGHSSFSAAAAEVLRRFTGSDSFGATHVQAAHSLALEPQLPSGELTLRWLTFSAAAEQAGLSRIYGGIHFDSGNAAGQALGRKVGALAFATARGLWQAG